VLSFLSSILHAAVISAVEYCYFLAARGNKQLGSSSKTWLYVLGSFVLGKRQNWGKEPSVKSLCP